MQFDLDVPEQGEGFKFFSSRVKEDGSVEYGEPAPDAAMFYLRPLGPKVEEFQAKRKRKVEHVYNPQTRQMERLAYFEELPSAEAKQQTEDLWDYVITGWENALDAKGEPIPVARENKLKFMRLPVFDRFVARCLQVMASAGVKAQEADAKN